MAESSTSPKFFFEHAKSVMTLKSGRTINQSEITQESKPSKLTELEKNKSAEREEPIKPAPIPKAPFSSALESPLSLDKKGIKMNEMLKLFKQVQINLPLFDAIK